MRAHQSVVAHTHKNVTHRFRNPSLEMHSTRGQITRTEIDLRWLSNARGLRASERTNERTGKKRPVDTSERMENVTLRECMHVCGLPPPPRVHHCIATPCSKVQWQRRGAAAAAHDPRPYYLPLPPFSKRASERAYLLAVAELYSPSQEFSAVRKAKRPSWWAPIASSTGSWRRPDACSKSFIGHRLTPFNGARDTYGWGAPASTLWV